MYYNVYFILIKYVLLSYTVTIRTAMCYSSFLRYPIIQNSIRLSKLMLSVLIRPILQWVILSICLLFSLCLQLFCTNCHAIHRNIWAWTKISQPNITNITGHCIHLCLLWKYTQNKQWIQYPTITQPTTCLYAIYAYTHGPVTGSGPSVVWP